MLPPSVQSDIDHKDSEPKTVRNQATTQLLNVAASIATVDMSQSQQNPVMAAIRLKTLRLEYQLLQKYAPVGVFLMPSDPIPGDVGP